ncbi:MAG TPA: YciI-like protein [Thermodesulfobacteriota bacterium]|nr:YciI-like protein [Thermodesulfobacteriota bacterium]
MNSFVLFYELVDNFVARRAEFREEHLKLIDAAHRGGGLVLAGALMEPADRALLVFRSQDRSAAENFARKDPYVVNGLVTRWEVRPWAVVTGQDPLAAMKGGAR